ncbi:TIGR00161 family protein [Archaeoglobus sulfaticallidus PM70-1]|uniref:TIGR00161 family protein n=1 Tax=Archaeoglobus sulfaticallidus PM70-1 TaxID=387631 RepID=N0BGY7_9EURY|nr:proteasome assembly chaperone family protein [Archaeoglobus sulfaticallidus]AGK61527.1 TIGR00161 family protein [Archaeoglobus sulfaticallidus PM70-1]
MVNAEIIVSELSVENPVLIASFPGIGLVGTIATAHIITESKLEHKGVISSDLFPPVAMLMEGIISPPIRIYESLEHNAVLIHSDIPIGVEISSILSREIIKFAKSINAKRIYSLAGVATFEGKHRVFGAATTKELLDEIKEHVEVFNSGTISGLAGSILNECVYRNFPGLALLGETSSFNPDPRASAQIIQVLNRIFGWEINIDRLIQEAEYIEAHMQKLAEQTRAHEERIPKKEEFPMYG